ncbi:Stf0 family sulfotransferase [Aestuariivirga sp.]|uniref:Stf0 family sulfotransferase n=1 Tax=Aestuariivirga sp. TaxID=2650926 RepID=UPI0039E3CB11
MNGAFPERNPAFDGYIICGTPRTGSTLLCGLLKMAKAGAPHSFYRRQNIAEWAESWGVPAPGTVSGAEFDTAYLQAAIRAGRGGTDIFGMRLMKENLGEVSGILDRMFPGLPSDKARLERAFGQIAYLHLSREDKLAQAVSLIKAQQTGLWHVAPDGTEIERVAPPQELQYDSGRIARELAALEGYDAAWNTWFATQGINPIRIGYQALAAAPAATLSTICGKLGLPAPALHDVKPEVAILADATSLDWMRRFRAERQAMA